MNCRRSVPRWRTPTWNSPTSTPTSAPRPTALCGAPDEPDPRPSPRSGSSDAAPGVHGSRTRGVDKAAYCPLHPVGADLHHGEHGRPRGPPDGTRSQPVGPPDRDGGHRIRPVAPRIRGDQPRPTVHRGPRGTRHDLRIRHRHHQAHLRRHPAATSAARREGHDVQLGGRRDRPRLLRLGVLRRPSSPPSTPVPRSPTRVYCAP